jgi:ABC-2 type transport system ATP-binding protein
MLKVDNLFFEYPKKRALSDVTFQIEKGSITALVGPNGAGKTTLLRCIAGLETPFSGRINLDGIDVIESPKLAHQKIGYLSDFFGVYEHLTIEQCLIYSASIRTIKDADIKAEILRVAKLLGIESRLGEVLRSIMARTSAHIVAMTGSYFRGDCVPVLLPEDEAKTGESKVQELTDKFNKKVDEVLAAKDKDIMTI